MWIVSMLTYLRSVAKFVDAMSNRNGTIKWDGKGVIWNDPLVEPQATDKQQADPMRKKLSYWMATS